MSRYPGYEEGRRSFGLRQALVETIDAEDNAKDEGHGPKKVHDPAPQAGGGERVSDGYCWMSLDLDYAIRLATAAREYGLKWLEEALIPDDYWGYRDLRKAVPRGMLISTGEHESTRYGFRMLLEMGCADILQPDVGWCGGITELIKISALADAYGALVVPHGSSVYSYHFVVTRTNSPFAEFLMMAPEADEVLPMFSPLLVGEPVPVNGRMKVPDTPGFGVELNPDVELVRPVAR
jgi:L-rhamnonate dehydratase